MLSGVFVLPGLAFDYTGPSVWIAFLVAGLSVLPAAMSKAELATAMPASGGTYIYISRAFGPLAGTVSGLGLWMSLLLKSAFALVAFAAYVYMVAPTVNVTYAALGLLLAITALNIMGVSKVSKAQVFVVSLSLAGLFALMFMSGDHAEFQRFSNPFPDGAGGFLAASGFVFVSYSGVTKVAAMAEEIKNPEKNLPLAMFLALTIAAVLYGSIAFCLVLVVPADQLSGNEAPIYNLGTIVGGSQVGVVVVVLAVLTMTAMAAAGLLASSRFPFAMSRDKLLPDALSHISQRFKTPVVGILATSAVMAVAILTLDIGPIAKLASAFKIVIFIAVNVALIVLRESRAEWYQPKYRSPLYPWVQIFGIVTELILLFTLGLGPLLTLLVIMVIGAVIYFLYGAKRTSQRGVISRLQSRRQLIEETYSSGTLELRRLAKEQMPAVLVAVDRRVRSPEMLVEMGVALSQGRTVRTIHTTEVAEQILELDAVEEELSVQSLRRRVIALGTDQEHDVQFESFVSHDATATIHRVASETGPVWTVLEWLGRRRRDLFIRNPRHWLYRHLPCNLALFHDNGIRYIREILVFPQPGPDDALVMQTAARLSIRHRASVTCVGFVADTQTDEFVQSKEHYLNQLIKLAQIEAKTLILRGKSFEETLAKASPGYDLLIMGSPTKRGLNSIFGTVYDQLTEMAGCSVLRLSTPHDAVHAPFSSADENQEYEQFGMIAESCLGAQVEVSNKSEAFEHMASKLAQVLDTDAESVLTALWSRERTQNTSIGPGVALPHATLSGIASTQVGVFTLKKPIDYQAVDGTPVDVIVVTLGPPEDRQAHLLLLATVSKLIKQTAMVDALREAKDTEGLREVLNQNLEALT